MTSKYSRILCSLLIPLTIISCRQKNEETDSQSLINTVINSPEDTNKKKEFLADTNMITVTAMDLTSEYVANEVKADHDYKGKQIIVSGIVTDIKKGIGDNIYVILQGIERSRSVQCYYDDETGAQALKKGQKVFFRGTCDGLWVNVIVSDCERVGEFIN